MEGAAQASGFSKVKFLSYPPYKELKKYILKNGIKIDDISMLLGKDVTAILSGLQPEFTTSDVRSMCRYLEISSSYFICEGGR